MAKSNAPEKIEKSIKNSKSGRLLSKDEKKGKNTPTSATNKRSHRISTSDLGRVNEVALSRKINGKSKNNTIVKADNFQNIADPKKGLPLILKNGEQDSLKVMSKSKSGFPLLFNTKRKEYIEQYLRGLIVIMRLQDWTITLDWSSSGDQDVYATIISSPDQKRATLNLTIKFLELDNSERAQTARINALPSFLTSLSN